MEDQNHEIIHMIKARMELGIERYGHGMRVDDDTRQWGTCENSWEEMALEEVLDCSIYMAAQILRIKKKRTINNQKKITDYFTRYGNV